MLACLFKSLLPKPPAPRSDGPLYWKVCFVNQMGTSYIVVALALCGLAVSVADLCHRLQRIAMPPDDATNGSTCSAAMKWQPGPVSQNVERQIKLMASIMSFENHFLLLAGILLDSTSLMIPWLAVQTITVLVELLVFCSQIAIVGLHVGRVELLTTVTTIHNFLQVFCFLCKKRVIC